MRVNHCEITEYSELFQAGDSAEHIHAVLESKGRFKRLVMSDAMLEYETLLDGMRITFTFAFDANGLQSAFRYPTSVVRRYTGNTLEHCVRLV